MPRDRPEDRTPSLSPTPRSWAVAWACVMIPNGLLLGLHEWEAGVHTLDTWSSALHIWPWKASKFIRFYLHLLYFFHCWGLLVFNELDAGGHTLDTWGSALHIWHWIVLIFIWFYLCLLYCFHCWGLLVLHELDAGAIHLIHGALHSKLNPGEH